MTNRVAMIRSNNLLTMLRRLMGLYEEVTEGGLSVLLTDWKGVVVISNFDSLEAAPSNLPP